MGKIINFIKQFMSQNKCKIRNLAQLLGTLSAACPAVTYGRRHTKLLEREKFLALQSSNENFEKYMNISSELIPELKWWLCNIPKAKKSFATQKICLEIFTDSSLTGWGAHCLGESIGGLWNSVEKEQHINYLEIVAAYFGLRSFAKNLSNCHILLRIDNTTAISCINKMGSVQFTHLNTITQELWQWCEDRNIWVTASYIKSKENTEADRESRNLNHDTEWSLADYAYIKITQHFGTPEIDLFASRINTKCVKYVSWKRDPMAFDIDAFTLNWSEFFFYAFPPFSVITKCLEKIRNDQAEGILVFPWWPAQPWFPLAKLLMISKPIIFDANTELLSSPFSKQHRLSSHLTLAAGHFSGRHFS